MNDQIDKMDIKSVAKLIDESVRRTRKHQSNEEMSTNATSSAHWVPSQSQEPEVARAEPHTSTDSPHNMTLTAFFGLLLVFFLTKIEAQSISDSGWRPISSEKVFGSRNFIKTPLSQNFEQARNLAEFRDSTFGANIELTDSSEIYPQDFHPQESSYLGKDFKQASYIENTDYPGSKSTAKNTKIPKSSFRIGKKMSNPKVTENEITNYADIKEELSKNTELDVLKNTYKISEENEDTTGEQSNVITSQEHPHISEIGEPNLTKNFLKILSNYNIRSSDRLPNYSLSLRQNSRQSPGEEYIYMNVPIRLPLRYNSPDHLPVDPLLAVLLSNYGFYLPGYYGVNGNYQNLYGYSAANNIHNNKPFGSYKIFSDTDSFH